MKFRKDLMIPLFFLIVGLCSYIFIFPKPKEDYHSINVAGANWGNLEVLIENSHNHLKPCGHLIIEHGIGQAQEIKKKLASHHFTQISSHKDLANINRIVTAQQVSPEYG